MNERRKKHPIPPKRRARRKALWCAAAVVALSAVLVVLLACRMAPPVYEIELPVHELPVPTAAPQPAFTAWARYDVPFEEEFQRYITETAESYGLDPALVLAVIHYETGGTYDPFALGDGGQSYGLMQVWASEHTERMARLGVTDLYDPYQNVLVGCDILAEVIGWGNGLEWALSFYHGASGADCEYSRLVMAKAEELSESAVMMAA